MAEIIINTRPPYNTVYMTVYMKESLRSQVRVGLQNRGGGEEGFNITSLLLAVMSIFDRRPHTTSYKSICDINKLEIGLGSKPIDI